MNLKKIALRTFGLIFAVPVLVALIDMMAFFFTGETAILSNYYKSGRDISVLGFSVASMLCFFYSENPNA